MNNQKIEQLLDKYFAGETSIQEEKQLKTYFLYGKVNSDFIEYAPLFNYFSAATDQEVSKNFDEKLFGAIDDLSEPDTLLKITRPQAKVFRINLKFISRIAAVILVATAVWWIYPETSIKPEEQSASIDWSKYEVKTAEEAYEATLMALTKTSYEMNLGINKAASEMSKARVRWKLILK